MKKNFLHVSFPLFNLLFTLISFFCFNIIFLRKLLSVTGFGLPFIIVILVILLLLFIAADLLLWPHTAKPSAILILFLNAFCFYFMNTYHVSIDKIMLLNAFQTDLAEASDLLSFRLFLCLLVGALLPALLISRIHIRFLPWRQELRRRLTRAFFLIIVIGAVIFPNYKYTAQFLRNHRRLKYDLLPVNYFGAVISAVQIIYKKHHPLVRIGTDAVFSPYWNNHKPLLLVIVIGETARAQNFSLGGYPRDTNRDLEPWRNQLLYFGDTSACGTSTAVSLPCIFSAQRRRTFKPGSEAYTENLLDVFQRVGYRVLWRENNSGCKNNCDRVKTETFCSNYACKDEILLKDFIPTVKSLPGNTVIVLHQQGSHGPAYHRRYPDHFKRYTPVCTTADLSRCLQNEIINAYDNSIAYTSYVLAQTISLLSRLSADYNTLMLFVSDHGESLGEKGLYLHAAPYIIAPREQTKVPMLIWLSPANAEALKIDLSCARKTTAGRRSHENIFHTLLGLGGINTAEYRENLDIFASCRKK